MTKHIRILYDHLFRLTESQIFYDFLFQLTHFMPLVSFDTSCKHLYLFEQVNVIWAVSTASGPLTHLCRFSLFLYSLKTFENLCFSDVFRGYRKRSMTWNRLIKFWIIWRYKLKFLKILTNESLTISNFQHNFINNRTFIYERVLSLHTVIIHIYYIIFFNFIAR